MFTKGKDIENYDARTKTNNIFLHERKKMEKQANQNFKKKNKKNSILFFLQSCDKIRSISLSSINDGTNISLKIILGFWNIDSIYKLARLGNFQWNAFVIFIYGNFWQKEWNFFYLTDKVSLLYNRCYIVYEGERHVVESELRRTNEDK